MLKSPGKPKTLRKDVKKSILAQGSLTQGWNFWSFLRKGPLRKDDKKSTLAYGSLTQGWKFWYPCERVPYARMTKYRPLRKRPERFTFWASLRKGPLHKDRFSDILLQGILP